MVEKKRWLRVMEFCAFMLALVVMLILAENLTEHKQSRNLFGGFLKEPEAYDVLFFGDSQFMNGMIPLEMWEDYGIAGYNLSCYGSVIPTSYWTMINAFDYAEPELVVFAINGINEMHKVSNYSGDLHTALDFWPLTPTKVRMINDLLHDPEDPDFTDVEGKRYRDLEWEFYFTLLKYHSRWRELKREDFTRPPAYVKGGESLVGIAPIWEYELVGEDRYAEEGGHAYAYLRATIEECQRREIEVLLVHLPAPQYVDSQRHANTVRSLATEYGVDFIDITYLDSIVDYAVDCFDDEPHLNLSGTLKMTSFLGSYIRDHYNLPDRRNDPRYAHWDTQMNDYKDQKIRTLRSQKELNNVLMLLHDQDFDIRLNLRPDAFVFDDDLSILLMHNIARERILSGDEYDKGSAFMFPLEGFDAALCEGEAYHLRREGGMLIELTGPEAESESLEIFGSDAQSAVMIEVVDRRNGKVAAIFRFNQSAQLLAQDA